ncbi:MAG: 3-oxoacyl-ACP reductase [Rhodospirillaceae bacterium TMED8]|nr:3-oxoacyl-ACP reductase [Magnetovibrio sp.]OUT50874.1 MAG: 3-oxoacyl-ACP reductase [Rhodospirillaceae bacterium TMED8]
MDLGIQGRRAIVCAASKGLGRSCAESLVREGVDVVICARSKGPLEETAKSLRALGGGAVSAVACDVTTEEGRGLILSVCPDPDILINNAGGPPPGDFRDWEREDWIKAIDANMLSPILLIKRTIDSMIERQFGRVINITSGAVKSPIDILGLSNGSRAGLTGFVAGLSRTTVKHNVTINNLLPGPFDTDRLRENLKVLAAKHGISVEEMTKKRASGNPAGRFGTAYEFGEMCAFVCSAQAGFMTGQNFLIDGGAFRSTL